MERKLKVTKTSLLVLPNETPNKSEFYFDLNKGQYTEAGLKFDIVETNSEYLVLNIYLGVFYETGFRQYVFDSTYPITLAKSLDGSSSKYTFELIWV